MTQFTLLQIGQKIAQRLQLPIISTIFGSTDNNLNLLLAMIEKAVNEIKDEFPWPELTKRATITLVTGQSEYALPADYDSRLTDTLWNQTQRRPLLGPIDAVTWETVKSGLITTLPLQRFRVFGYGNATFQIDPVPTAAENGQVCVYEYISSYAIQTGSGPNTYGEEFTADTNIVLLDGWLIINGALWRYKREKGQEYEELRRDAEAQIEAAKTKLMGATVLSTNSMNRTPPMIGVWSYPDGNY
jgi:hypothetical protein